MTNIDTQIIFDKNGNPIPQYLDVADKTGGSAGTMKPITGQNGAQFTQLTGSIMEEETLLPRGLYTSNRTSLGAPIRTPKGAIGLIVSYIIHGITGVFSEGQGVGGQIYNQLGSSNRFYYILDRKTGRGVYTYNFYRDAQKKIIEKDQVGINTLTENEFNISHIPLNNLNYRVDLLIDGAFSDGEGIDAEVKLFWIYS